LLKTPSNSNAEHKQSHPSRHMQFLYTAGVLFSFSRSAFVTNLLAYFLFSR
jgi:hypothetical protein